MIIAPIASTPGSPAEARARIEWYADGPCVELFSREASPGWTAWGNEAGKFTDKSGAPADARFALTVLMQLAR